MKINYILYDWHGKIMWTYLIADNIYFVDPKYLSELLERSA